MIFQNNDTKQYFKNSLASCETTKSTVYQPDIKTGYFSGGADNFKIDALEIKKVDKNTDLADKLICFAENFSWEEVKDHLLSILRSWAFTDWEAPFASTANGQIIGMALIMKTDYYPLPDIYPWISCIFVTEEYRGCRISEKLIAFANEYAKESGFARTYIPTEHIGLYEKFGYTYLKNIINYGGGTDRLYFKELK